MSVPRDLSIPEVADIGPRIRDQRPAGHVQAQRPGVHPGLRGLRRVHGQARRGVAHADHGVLGGSRRRRERPPCSASTCCSSTRTTSRCANAENGRLRQIIAGRDVPLPRLRGLEGPRRTPPTTNRPTGSDAGHQGHRQDLHVAPRGAGHADRARDAAERRTHGEVVMQGYSQIRGHMMPEGSQIREHMMLGWTGWTSGHWVTRHFSDDLRMAGWKRRTGHFGNNP